MAAWASAGKGKRGHLPPPLGRPKWYVFFDYLKENSF